MARIKRAPYYDTDSYNTYREMLEYAKYLDAQDPGRNQKFQDAALNANREQAMQQVDRIGAAGGDQSYKRWSGYDIDDPDRPTLPALHSGPTSGGTSLSSTDYRTDQYLEGAAQATVLDRLGRLVGPLAGFKDKRSREYLALYGPGGPLNRMARNVDPKLRKKLLEAQEVPITGIPQSPRYSLATKFWGGLRAARERIRR